MILNLDKQPAGRCFEELNDALVAMGRGDVCLNAHAAPEATPGGATVWHYENEPAVYPKAREVWTFSRRQAEATGGTWKHVPIGHHKSFERFDRAHAPDVDVVFMGCLNDRRVRIFKELAGQGLQVVLIPPGIYGKERDALLARAKLVVAPLFYPDGMFCGLRAAHLVSNKVPCLFEEAPEVWPFLRMTSYGSLVQQAVTLLRTPSGLTSRAEGDLHDFRAMPLVLPS